MADTQTHIEVKLSNFIQYLSGFRLRTIITSLLIINLLISFSFSYLFFPSTKISKVFDSFTEEFIIVIIIAPAIETYMIQTVIISFVIEKFNSKLIALCISAGIFGLLHYYSISYIIKGILSGIVYGLAYMAIMKKQKKVFLYVWLMHSLHNLFAFIANHYIDT